MGTNQFAIVIAAVIIGAAIVAAQFVGRYQVASAAGTDGSPFVWRLDTRTGEIQSCTFYKNDDPFAEIIDPKQKVLIRCNGNFAP